MVRRSVTPKVTFPDALSYVRSVKEALHDEPEKYRELLKLMKDYRRGLDAASVIARVGEILKDHRNLLRGFSVFLPDGATKTLPPRADKARFIPTTPTKEDLDSYLTAVKAAFHDNPLKYYVFFNHFCSLRRNKSGIHIAGDIGYLEELLQDHQDLLLRLNAFLPAETQRFLHQRAVSEDNRRKRAASFVAKIEARFQGNDRHVYESFLEMMKMYKKGNKSEKELLKEFSALFQGHRDLIKEFSKFSKTL